MRVLLQQTASGLWWAETGVWAPAKKSARAFGSMVQAIDFCQEQRLGRVQIVLSFPDPRWDIVIRLLADGQPSHPDGG